MKRNALISNAFKKIGAHGGRILTADKLAEGIEALNLIMLQESARGSDTSRHLWAMHRRALILIPEQGIYMKADGLEDEIAEIAAAAFRSIGGADRPVRLLTGEQWLDHRNQNETGDVRAVYLAKTGPSQLYVWPRMVVTTAPPAPSVVADPANLDRVYVCTRAHVAAEMNRPPIGSDWPRVWDLYTGSLLTADIDAPWKAGTTYTSAPLLMYEFKRPLHLFTCATDDPDMPPDWQKYLILQLAYDLAPNYSITLEEQQYLRKRVDEAWTDLFGSTRAQANDCHHKAEYF